MSLLWSDGHQFSSNIVWCEEKYAYTILIAEFWNTLTNVLFISLAILYIKTSLRLKLRKRFLICFVFLAFVGVGSTLFHATLKYEFQLLDEIPMMLLAGQSIWCMLDSKKPIFSFVSIYACLLGGTLLYLAFNLAYLFHAIFGLFVLVIIILAYYLASKDAFIRKPMIISLALNGAALACWLLDRGFCAELRGMRFSLGMGFLFQLHGWWHILTSFGLIWFICGIIIYNDGCPRRKTFYQYKTFAFILPIIYEK